MVSKIYLGLYLEIDYELAFDSYFVPLENYPKNSLVQKMHLPGILCYHDFHHKIHSLPFDVVEHSSDLVAFVMLPLELLKLFVYLCCEPQMVSLKIYQNFN